MNIKKLSRYSSNLNRPGDPCWQSDNSLIQSGVSWSLPIHNVRDRRMRVIRKCDHLKDSIAFQQSLRVMFIIPDYY